MKVALVHHAYTPVIGGVAFVLEQHALFLTRRGHQVKVVCGSGKSIESGVSLSVVPEFLPSHPECVAAQKSLRTNGDAFNRLKYKLLERFRDELKEVDVVFIHNVMTMHFNLAATDALALWAWDSRGGNPRFINWCHDISAINADFGLEEKLDSFPWKLLKQKLPGFEHVVVSPERQRQYCKLTGLTPKNCSVVPNGVDYLRLLKLTKPVKEFVRRYVILSKDIVIIHPTRIARRKNLECGILTLAKLKEAGYRCVYLVTGAPDRHNEASHIYGDELKKLIVTFGVQSEFLFVNELFKVTDADLNSLYMVSDLLFLPSRQEGVGLPLLEAGLFRKPVFCSRKESMQSVPHDVNVFDLDDEPTSIAAKMLHVLTKDPGYNARKEVLNRYSWDRIFDEKISPLFLK